MRQKRSESARERRIALYKSDHHHQNMSVHERLCTNALSKENTVTGRMYTGTRSQNHKVFSISRLHITWVSNSGVPRSTNMNVVSHNITRRANERARESEVGRVVLPLVDRNELRRISFKHQVSPHWSGFTHAFW